MGGVGKTQLAVEYGHRHADEYDVIWLIAAEQDGLIGGQLHRAAVAASLVGPDVHTAAAVEAVHAAVQRKRHRWLLIFDNAEAPQTLAPWLPARGGHVIITSRSLGWDELAAPVEVDLFDRGESITLLQRRLPGLPAGEAERLAEHLSHLPLAVAQAAIFMTDTGMPTDDYLANTTELLDNGRPDGYPTSLAASINLAADRLDRDHPAAAPVRRTRTGADPADHLHPFDRAAGRPGVLPTGQDDRGARPRRHQPAGPPDPPADPGDPPAPQGPRRASRDPGAGHRDPPRSRP